MVRSMICTIVPPSIFETISKRGSEQQKAEALRNLNETAQLRGRRLGFQGLAGWAAVSPGVLRRTVYDAQNGMQLPGVFTRGEGDPKSRDVAVNEAYDGSGLTYNFYFQVYDRNSIDGNGMRLDSTVHYRRNFSNAMWNGVQMVYGDGDGDIFQRFTKSLDVIGHELTHGVTEYEAGLRYSGQPGALNEHFSDVFGSLVKQYAKKQNADQADWLIGAGLFTSKIHGTAIRSMKAPGTAYDDPLIGKDLQPAHMKDFVDTTDDNGGVHINSGIPNKAFYNLAVALGGHAWEKAGKIWYVTLVEKVKPGSDFEQCAQMTLETAGALYGAGSKEQKAVRVAWADVGIEIS
ncbi:MAG TPA: M4 family metallopeptidase [Acidobacteriota bacterium]|nr:M4 family metallopeptidase [Acidobacteriota bacterium]